MQDGKAAVSLAAMASKRFEHAAALAGLLALAGRVVESDRPGDAGVVGEVRFVDDLVAVLSEAP